MTYIVTQEKIYHDPAGIQHFRCTLDDFIQQEALNLQPQFAPRLNTLLPPWLQLVAHHLHHVLTADQQQLLLQQTPSVSAAAKSRTTRQRNQAISAFLALDAQLERYLQSQPGTQHKIYQLLIRQYCDDFCQQNQLPVTWGSCWQSTSVLKTEITTLQQAEINLQKALQTGNYATASLFRRGLKNFLQAQIFSNPHLDQFLNQKQITIASYQQPFTYHSYRYPQGSHDPDEDESESDITIYD